MKSCSKPNGDILCLSYPIDLDLFNEEAQSCVTLAYHFLGLDTNAYITDPLLSLLFFLFILKFQDSISSPVVLNLMSF